MLEPRSPPPSSLTPQPRVTATRGRTDWMMRCSSAVRSRRQYLRHVARSPMPLGLSDGRQAPSAAACAHVSQRLGAAPASSDTEASGGRGATNVSADAVPDSDRSASPLRGRSLVPPEANGAAQTDCRRCPRECEDHRGGWPPVSPRLQPDFNSSRERRLRIDTASNSTLASLFPARGHVREVDADRHFGTLDNSKTTVD